MQLHSRVLALGALAVASTLLPAMRSEAAPTPPAAPQATVPAFDTGTIPPEPTQHAASRPEVAPGARTTLSSTEALAASAAECNSLRYCAWTGGYFTGPSITFVVGASYNWRDYSQAKCSSSGTSGPNWSNCASSTRNRSTYATAYYFALPNGTGFYENERSLGSHETLGVFNNNIDSSVAA